jgi:cell division protein FtsQ
MLKKILTTVCTVLAAAYLFLAVTAFNRKPAGRVCEDLGHT